MSKDHSLNLYIEPDIDSDIIKLAHHRTRLVLTHEIVKDQYSFPGSGEDNKFEKVVAFKRGSAEEPQILFRRIK